MNTILDSPKVSPSQFAFVNIKKADGRRWSVASLPRYKNKQYVNWIHKSKTLNLLFVSGVDSNILIKITRRPREAFKNTTDFLFKSSA